MRRIWRLIVALPVSPGDDRVEELRASLDRLSSTDFPPFYPRAALIDVLPVDPGDPPRIHVFRGASGEDFDAYLRIEVEPGRSMTSQWLERQVLAGFDALDQGRDNPREGSTAETLPVMLRGVGAPGEPITVDVDIDLIGPPMPFLWASSYLGSGDIAKVLGEWWRPSGRADLKITLKDELDWPFAKVRMEKFVCRVWVPIARPTPTASVRELILHALAGARAGLQLARKRAGLAEPAPLPTDDEFVRGVLDLRGSRFDDRG